MRYRIVVAGFFLALIAGGVFILPPAWRSFRYLLSNDPAEITRLGLQTGLTASRLNAEIARALDAGEADMAASFMTLAEQENMEAAVSPDLRNRHAEAFTISGRLSRCWDGVWNDKSDNSASFACNAPSQLTRKLLNSAVPVEDVYETAGAVKKYANGEQIDSLRVSFALAGLALYGTGLLTEGMTFAGRFPLLVLKQLTLAGRTSQPLKEWIQAILKRAIDVEKILASLKTVERNNADKILEVIKDSVKLNELQPLLPLTYAIVSLSVTDNGIPLTLEAMTMTREPEEFERIVSLSAERKGATAATIRLLGRGTIEAPEPARTLLIRLMAGVSYGTAVLVLIAAAGWRRLRQRNG
jgi:hypothetical protein